MLKILLTSAIDPLSDEETRYNPLWPAYLAAYARMHIGPGQVAFRYARANVERSIREFGPALVGISSVTQNYDIALRIAATAKRRGLPVIVGGQHISALPRSLGRTMDIGVMGEGEKTFLDLLALFLEEGRFRPDRLSAIEGIAFRDGDDVVVTPPRQPNLPMGEIPHPDRSLVGYGRRLYVHTARGCASDCAFCGARKHWGRLRLADPEYVMEEIRELESRGARVVRYNDDDFGTDGRRVARIAELVRAAGLHRKIRFSCWSRARSITPDVVSAYRAMNVVAVTLGLESGSSRILAYLKGDGASVDDNRTAVHRLKNAGIQVTGDFIIGAPDESAGEIAQTFEFARTNPVDFINVNLFTALPGTRAWTRCAEMGLVSDDMTDWARLCFKMTGKRVRPLVVSEMMDYGELLRWNARFRRLGALKAMKAIPRSPWRLEYPGIAVRRSVNWVRKGLRRLHRGDRSLDIP